MGGGILANLMRKADDTIYNGLTGLSKYPNGIGMGRGTLKQKAMQRFKNIDDVFAAQDLSRVMGKDNLQIRDAGGGGAPLLQDLYEILTKRK